MSNPSKRERTPLKAANDNAPGTRETDFKVYTDMPGAISPLPGEADLVARFLASVLANPANDNEPPEEQ